MSAQAYTNRRRIRAEASVVKAQYPKGITVNRNAIYATLNCLPNFQQITYIPICRCPFNGRGIIVPPIPLLNIVAIDGGSAETDLGDISLWVDGGNAGTLYVAYWFDGGNAGKSGYYDGGNAFSNPTTGIDGGNAGPSFYYNGGGAFSNPTTGIDGGNAGAPFYYNGGGAFSNPTSGISGGNAGAPFYYNGGGAFSISRSTIDGGIA
jgi:hypothetical protein